ncbi:MBL fold metallo-hydrolase [Spongiibacter sp. KMU-158]|uniref:MBL fold metallo-hydrolase n=1 Tax=Spongiibacter pelagi TaxID=2760804 RepID=A0A927C3Q8_9GAMM|nr:MBL fold metallo-hydrolase [Spongiibacter pelagi]MBD2859613.1 MBL fold metallo-hydrolase [Spongiibacter pelagi]
MAKLIFLGGTETVTGSKYLLETDTTRVLIDCGLYQGYKWLRERNWQTLPLDMDSLDAVILTHAHLDHSGYVPVLYKRGYRGPVYCHPATKALCQVLLTDSGHIQEEDARFYARHKIGKHQNPEPLYDRHTAEKSLSLFKTVEFEQRWSVGDIHFRLQAAGHILGASSVIAEVDGKTIGFSGDVGRLNDEINLAPKALPKLDHLLLESTYGNRRHHQGDSHEQLEEIVTRVAKSGGVLLIPAFAVGRTQTIQLLLRDLMDQGRIPNLPVYLDSPMAIDVSEIYCRFTDNHRLDQNQCQRMNGVATQTREVDESKALSEIQFPHIIIAGSGMATGGRILHHFKRLLGKPNTVVLFTGYQAGGTRGAKMQQGVDAVKIHGEWYRLKASVEVLHGLSGHADYEEIGQWLDQSEVDKNTQIHLVHGEAEALEAQREYLCKKDYCVSVAGYRDVLHI